MQKIVELTRQAKNGPSADAYPKTLNTPGKRALYDNLGKDEARAVKVDRLIRDNRQADWRTNTVKLRSVFVKAKGYQLLMEKGTSLQVMA
jgi:type I restriction enzyme, R subunit